MNRAVTAPLNRLEKPTSAFPLPIGQAVTDQPVTDQPMPVDPWMVLPDPGSGKAGSVMFS